MGLAKPFIVVGKYATPAWEARLRDIFDAVLYVLTTGCQWRQLPKDFRRARPCTTGLCAGIARALSIVCISRFTSKRGIST